MANTCSKSTVNKLEQIACRCCSAKILKLGIYHTYLPSTAWKVSKYGVISRLSFPAFRLNTEIYSINIRIQSKCRKKWTRNNSVFGHFSRSEKVASHFQKVVIETPIRRCPVKSFSVRYECCSLFAEIRER